MSEERMEFATIDPLRDERAFEAALGRILDDASEELARRRRAAPPLVEVAGWARPLLAAAAVVAAISLAGLSSAPRPDPSRAGGIAEAVGVPPELGPLVRDEREVAVTDLMTLGGMER